MKNKIILLLIISVFTFNNVKAQTNINNYKYVIIPNTFDFLKEPDQYRLNTLTKLLFQKYGFTSMMEEDILPDDAISNNCLALHANVLREPGVFNSKLKIQLKDCKNNIVFTSNIGKSKEKSYDVAYNLALREAFKSFDTFKYQYEESETILAYAKKDKEQNQSEIEKLKEEIKTLKEEKVAVIEAPKEIEEVKEVKEVKKVKEVVQAKSEEKESIALVKSVEQEKENSTILYAQKIATGFQLVDSTPNVVYKIRKTGMPNVYVVEGKETILYVLDNNWIIEYYENNTLKTKKLNIKF
ncbi:hypothetical protein [Lacinutrix cladophorae]